MSQPILNIQSYVLLERKRNTSYTRTLRALFLTRLHMDMAIHSLPHRDVPKTTWWNSQ